VGDDNLSEEFDGVDHLAFLAGLAGLAKGHPPARYHSTAFNKTVSMVHRSSAATLRILACTSASSLMLFFTFLIFYFSLALVKDLFYTHLVAWV
jgi:hypothetical protein